jgi:hypothetical protein
MATKAKKTAAPKEWKLANGVGIPKPCENGRTPTAWVAIASHPVHGLLIYGPWVDRAAAISWVDNEGSQHLAFEGYGNVRDYAWTVTYLDIPQVHIN